MISFNLEVLILIINIALAIFFLVRRWIKNRKQDKHKLGSSKYFGAEWVLVSSLSILKENKDEKMKKKSLGDASPDEVEASCEDDIWWRTD